MRYCCTHDHAAARLFSRFARLYRWRSEHRDFEPIQKQLIQAVEAVNPTGAELLEIGCGVGSLHHHLLERGASSAVGVDLSPEMIDQARALAEKRGLFGRCRYLVGDYLALEGELGEADITLMDKVICCHPLGPQLVAAALPHTRRALALTYPRRTPVTRLGTRLLNGLMRLLRSEFRVYLHDPADIERLARAAGFTRSHHGTAGWWQCQCFTRSPSPGE